MAQLLALALTLQPFITGLDSPLGIVNAGDSRLFIVQQHGTIVIWDGTRVLPVPFLDVRSIVSCCNERGLLGLAFDPHYAANGRFFVDYTDTAGNPTIARYTVSSSDPNRADPASRTVLLTIPHPNFANHNGGQLQFGPDGLLYIGVGDGGSGGDPNNHGQSISTLLGKILRIDVSGDAYTIPSSNPFSNEIWAYGLRNPWRFSFDRLTGDLWIADVGQNAYEEVDFQPAASRGGENYGWRVMEGFHCFNAMTCVKTGLTLPVAEYDHSAGDGSVTGGFRYRGAKYPRLRGTYLYGDYCSGTIRGIAQNADGSWSSAKLLTTSLRISSFGEDASGELYVADVVAGRIYRLGDAVTAWRHAASH
ncbi:MAG TPA: PQQ-dependent sugar dehydrogenase [Vicinamibacterales bacterium]